MSYYELPAFIVRELAEMADCNRPSTSEGASFLQRVYADVRSRVEDLEATPDGIDAGDFAFEIADSAVPVYYDEQIAVISDLKLYQARVDELGECETLSDAMAAALYDTAHNLIHALVRKVETHEAAPW